MLKGIAIAFCAALLFASAVHAQEQPAPSAGATVDGLVHTSDGVAIPGATLRLIDLSTGRAWVSWTDDSGHFGVPGLPPGHYRIEVAQLGFETATKEFDLSVTGTPALALTLKVAALANLAQTGQLEQPPGGPASGTPRTASSAGAANVNPSTPSAGEAAGSLSGNRAGNRRFGNRSNGQPGTQQGAEQNGQRGRGFQQVQLNRAQNAQQGQQQAEQPLEEAELNNDQAALGQTTSSDAFLLNGTVAQGEDIGGAPGGGFGGFPGGAGFDAGAANPNIGPGAAPGAQSPAGGFAGGPGAGPGAGPIGAGAGPGPGGPGSGGPGGGRGANFRGGGSGGGGRRGGGRGGPPQGAAALYGTQRIARQRANQIHFSLYDQYSNEAFDAKPFSLNGLNPPKLPAWNERLGGNIGGPLRIPHVYNGSDRTFFYINYDSTWARSAVDEYSTVPTQYERQNVGDFCDLPTQPQLYVPADPSQPFGTRANVAALNTSGLPCQLPSANINSAAQQLFLNYFPAPNLPGFADNYALLTTIPTQNNRLNTRVLHTFSPKFSGRVIYNFSQGANHAFQNFPELESDQSTRGQSVTLGLTQNYTKTWLNDSQLIFSRNRVLSLSNFANNDNVAAALGITGVSSSPLDWGPPQLSFVDYGGLASQAPSLARNQTYRFVDAFTNSRPKHTIQFGMEVRRIENNTLTDPTPEGLFSFTNLMSADLNNGNAVPGTGLDFASFLMGLPTTTELRFGTVTDSYYYRSWGYVGYVSDDWRATPTFTLQYGVRYEAYTPPSELYGHISDLLLDPTAMQSTVVVPGQTNPYGGALPASLIHGHYDNWAPRIGLAWRPPLKALSGKHTTTVRAGYSMFYNESIYSQLLNELSEQAPWADSQRLQASSSQTLTLQNGFSSSAPDTATNTYAVNPYYKLPYAQIWNLAIETNLATNTALSVTYTGTKGTNLDMLYALNRPAPGSTSIPFASAGNFIYDTSGGNSIYNALQVRLQHRQTRGLQFNLVYTYGKSLDDASSIGGGSPIVVQDPADLGAEYGLSSIDVRHQIRANYYYELPFGDRHRFAQKGASEALFGNWRLSGNIAVRSGVPFTALAPPSGANQAGSGGLFAFRADEICNPNLPADQRGPDDFFNTACFAAPAIGEYGDAGRNTIEGPGSFTWNFQVSKWFPFGRDNNRRVDVRWEITNLTNTPNFIGLSTTVGSPTFGRVVGVGSMRTMDVVARINF